MADFELVQESYCRSIDIQQEVEVATNPHQEKAYALELLVLGNVRSHQLLELETVTVKPHANSRLQLQKKKC